MDDYCSSCLSDSDPLEPTPAARPSAANPSSVSGGKRNRKRDTLEDELEKLLSRYNWIDSSASARATFRNHQRVRCVPCNVVLSSRNGASGVKSHNSNNEHRTSMQRALRRGSPQHEDGRVSAKAAAKAAAAVERGRATLALKAVTLMPKSAISKAYDNPHLDIANYLRKAQKPLEGEADVEAAIAKGLEFMKDIIRYEMADETLCVIIEEITSDADDIAADVSEKERKLAILFGCDAAGPPLLAKVACGISTPAEAATVIRETLEEYEINMSDQVTCVIGSNVGFSSKVAEQLGMEPRCCLVDVLHCIFNKLSAPFTKFRSIMNCLRVILNNDGAAARVAAIEDAGITVDMLNWDPSRCAEMNDVAFHFTEIVEDRDEYAPCTVFETLRCVFTESAAFGVKGAGLSLQQQVLNEQFEVGVPDEDRKFVANFECGIVGVLADGLPLLLPMSRQRADDSDPALLEELMKFRQRLREAAAPGLHPIIVERVVDRGYADYSSEEIDAFEDMYEEAIRTAAQAAEQEYDEYIPLALQQLRHRSRFDPKCQPEPLVIPAGRKLTVSMLQDFFGKSRWTMKLALAAEWNAYVAAWPSLHEDRELGIAVFWSETTSEMFPELARLGRWYANIPTYALERGAGILGDIPNDFVHRLTEAHAEAELMAAVNVWIMRRMVMSAHAAVFIA